MGIALRTVENLRNCHAKDELCKKSSKIKNDLISTSPPGEELEKNQRHNHPCFLLFVSKSYLNTSLLLVLVFMTSDKGEDIFFFGVCQKNPTKLVQRKKFPREPTTLLYPIHTESLLPSNGFYPSFPSFLIHSPYSRWRLDNFLLNIDPDHY